MSDLDVIKEIEQIIGKELKLCPPDKDIMSFIQSGCYLLNYESQVIGLNLFGYKLKAIDFLQPLDNLIQLDLRHNQLSDITALSALTNLTQLSLRDNQLSDITALSVLTNLTLLHLSENQLSDITALSTLTNLTQLSLSENQLSDITALSTLTNLTLLYLSNNQLSDITALSVLTNLTLLHLSNNQLKKLPEFLLDFNLPIKFQFEFEFQNGIYIIDNPLEEPPPEIVALGNQAIKQYFDAGERRAINELKVILVGSGGAGKTSLSKVLRDELFDNNENQTHGINIYKHCLGDININFWDFGGQEMQHATHQFFLSKRSLYILVLDDRKEDNAEYWLKYIESFGGNSPILVVLNKIDQHASFDVNRKFLQDKYQGIQGFYKLSCAKGYGLTEFKTGLFEAFTQVSLIRSQLPNTWLDFKNHLENLPTETNFIDYQSYRSLCAQRQINDSKTQEVLSQYLNDLGVIIHFTDPQLMGTPVLKPRWITQAVYKIIHFKNGNEAHGLFCLDNLPIVLAKHRDTDFDYPSEKYQHIIDLMKKFEICYEVDNRHILIPDLLEIQQPEFEFDDNDALRFRIRYDFLSRLIMPRFIVKSHLDIKEQLRWLTGVVLESKTYDACAKVTVDYEEKLIDIIVNGTQKQDHFAVIHDAFYKIHQGFDAKKFKFDEFVPLPDNPNYEVKYRELIGYKKAGRDEYFNGELGRSYRVATLLNGIEKPEARQKNKTGDNYYIHAHEVNMGRTINAGNYTEGNVTDSNIAGRDMTINNNTESLNKEQWLALLTQFKQELIASHLATDTIEEVSSNIAVIENQAKKAKPNGELINGLLDDTNQALNSIEQGGEKVLNLMTTLGRLGGFISSAL